MKNIRLLLIGLLLCCLIMAIPGRGTQPQASAQANNKVTITNNKFEPKKLTVPEGTTVIWENTQGAHTVKSDTNAFVSKTLKVGEKFEYQFTTSGTYPYHCTFHGNTGGSAMAGTIVVTKKK
jgi:plastocyanin